MCDARNAWCPAALIEQSAGREEREERDDAGSHFAWVLKQLVQEKIAGLPPGGGLAAKSVPAPPFSAAPALWSVPVERVLCCSRQALLDKIYREFYPEHADSSETFDCTAQLTDAFQSN